MPRYVLWHFRGLQTIAIDKLLLLFSLRSTFFPIEKACSGKKKGGNKRLKTLL